MIPTEKELLERLSTEIEDPKKLQEVFEAEKQKLLVDAREFIAILCAKITENPEQTVTQKESLIVFTKFDSKSLFVCIFRF